MEEGKRMKIEMIIEFIHPYVFLGCVMLGYLIKLWNKFEWIDNMLIPTILAVVGSISYFLIYSSYEKAIIGAFVGVAATGGYELVHNLVKLIESKVTGESS